MLLLLCATALAPLAGFDDVLKGATKLESLELVRHINAFFCRLTV